MKYLKEKPQEGDLPEEEKPQDSKKETVIKAYGRRKEEAVKPPETSQELRNFVNTNFH